MINKKRLLYFFVIILLPCVLGAQSIALLMDTSGSMNWKADGSTATFDYQKRITVSKDAAVFFLDVLMHNTLFPGNPNPHIGMARFPEQPYTGCSGEILESLQPLSLTALYTNFLPTINGLTTSGSTPMVDGLAKAQTILTTAPGPVAPQNILLLSDGYHNCPGTIAAGTADYNALIASLPGTAVHTIAIGRPGEPDSHFLEELATDTSGSFYDITADPGFNVNNPDLWDLENALKKTYLDILVNNMNYVHIDDPEGYISSNSSIEEEFFISDMEEQISIYLSWVTENREPLDLEIFASDGSSVPIKTDPKILYSEQTNYKLATIGPSILEEPGKVGINPWRIRIIASSIGRNPAKYQYGVIAKSNLNLVYTFDKNIYQTGEMINLNVKIPQGNSVNIESALVNTTRPEDGTGNWLSQYYVPLDEIANFSQTYSKRTGESISMVEAKNIYMQEMMQLQPPGRTKVETQPLLQISDKNSFHASFDNIRRAGTYSFYIKLRGRTQKGLPFTQEKLIQKFIPVNTTPDDIKLQSTLINQGNTDVYAIQLKPVDLYGNLLGPGYAQAINLGSTMGRFEGSLSDNLDGSYTHTLHVPLNSDPDQVNISLNLLSKKASYKLGSGAVVTGDSDGNGKIDIIDALTVAQYDIGLSSYVSSIASDVNCDGSIDIIDALYIAQYEIGLRNELGCDL